MPKSKMISIFNPFAGAYCELPIETVKQFIESAKEAEAKLAEAEGDADNE